MNNSEQREILGYAAPMDFPFMGIKKGAIAYNKDSYYHHFPITNGTMAIPTEIAQAFFTPIYAKTEAEEQAEHWDYLYEMYQNDDEKSFLKFLKQQTKFKLVRNEN